LAKQDEQHMKAKMLPKISSSSSKNMVKGHHLKAADVIKVVTCLEIQAVLKQKTISKPSISESMVRHWLAELGWQYEKLKNGMYIDGHERENVVSINTALLSDGNNTTVISIIGTMMETNFHGQTAFQSLVQLVTFLTYSGYTRRICILSK
jgi:hypothetical protein